MSYVYPAFVAVDPNNSANVAQNADGMFYAPTDTSHSTPLPITDLNGLPVGTARTNSLGIFGAYQLDVPEAVWVSGGVAVPVFSFKGVLDTVAEAANSAAAARSAAESAVAGGKYVQTNDVIPLPGSGSAYRTIELGYAPDPNTAPDIQRVIIQNIVTSWQNEWGALRGTPTPSLKDDALVRAVRRTDLGAGSVGGFIEMEDRTYPDGDARRKAFGIRWRDGTITRNQIDMALCYVRYGATALPAYLPEGTVVVTIND